MIEKDIQVKLSHGLHARPSAAIAGQLSPLNLKCAEMINGELTVDMKSIMSLLTACVLPKSTVHVKIEGQDEEKALKIVEEILGRESII